MATDFTIFDSPNLKANESAGPEAPGSVDRKPCWICWLPVSPFPCQVDPQGGVTYQDETVERDGKPEEQGQSWQEAWMAAVASGALPRK